MINVYVGIDVSCARNKRLPICFVTPVNRQICVLDIGKNRDAIPRGLGNAEIKNERPFRSAAKALAHSLFLIAAEHRWNIACIAIDAPAAPKRSSRQCEDQLNGDGLSLYTTPTISEWKEIYAKCREYLAQGQPLSRIPNSNKIWMQYGFEIFAALKNQGFSEIIEVYPYSIVCKISPGCPHKKTEDGYRQQLEAIAQKTGWTANLLEKELKAVPGSRHDKLDAFMSAWVASLPKSKRIAYGDPNDPSDSIWTPRMP